ncbi:MAG: UDP-N-acetylmuramoyl-tripeptide--D-alanyl-D-alanine ligase [Blautia sp.]|nr:UDP-N-acetylmuramoyl-tripeptide--D-alanyl-D-alanine ligase [Blautia sp.]
MKNLTVENITRVTGGTFYGDSSILNNEVLSITTDSREASPGCLFVPIVGERVDGHKFIPQVREAGALITLTEKSVEETGEPCIHVESSLQAVKDIAEFYLSGLGIPVVGISGSVGKTSTKEAVASVLSVKYNTLKTPGNFNNELGLPLTIFGLREEHEMAVLEMGISSFGEMTRLAKVAKPHTGVITNIGTCHLEFLGDRDGVFRAKTEMLDFIRPGGNIVLNGDDDKLIKVKESHGIQPVFYGLSTENNVYADNIISRGLRGTDCDIHLHGESFSVHIPVPGIHNVYNALAAAAVGHIYGLTSEEIRQGIENIETIQGRFRMIDTPEYLVVDDCYNASPASMKGSLGILKDADGRKVAVLGDMGELGKDEAEMHRSVGTFAATCGIDLLICTGTLCKEMAEAAKEAAASSGTDLKVIWEPDRESLLTHLPAYLQKGDTVLIKASRFMHFEKVVEMLS